jgi:hypothetical protein
VREEFNRAEALAMINERGRQALPLTILQRRLASSPEAYYQSLHRRSESGCGNSKFLQRGAAAEAIAAAAPALDADDVEDLVNAPENEVEAAEEELLDQATAAHCLFYIIVTDSICSGELSSFHQFKPVRLLERLNLPRYTKLSFKPVPVFVSLWKRCGCSRKQSLGSSCSYL